MVSCEVALTDHNGGITSRSSSVSIENASPTIDDSVTKCPRKRRFYGYKATLYWKFSDIDEDNLSIEYLWTMNSSLLSTNETYIVDPDETEVNEYYLYDDGKRFSWW